MINHNSIYNTTTSILCSWSLPHDCKCMIKRWEWAVLPVHTNRTYDPEDELDVSKLDNLRLFVGSVVLGEYSEDEAFSSTELIVWWTDDARRWEASECSPFSAMLLVKKKMFFTLFPKVDISAFTNFRWRASRACLRSDRSSGRYSQQRVALKVTYAFAPIPQGSTLTSSVSIGTKTPLLASAAFFFKSFTWLTTSASSVALSLWL